VKSVIISGEIEVFFMNFILSKKKRKMEKLNFHSELNNNIKNVQNARNIVYQIFRPHIGTNYKENLLKESYRKWELLKEYLFLEEVDLEEEDEEEAEEEEEGTEEEEVVSLITKIVMTIQIQTTRAKMSLSIKMNYDHYNILVIIFRHIYVFIYNKCHTSNESIIN